MAVPAYQSHQLAAYLANSTTYTIDKPTSLAVGDIMLAHIYSVSQSGLLIPISTTSGWTLLNQQNVVVGSTNCAAAVFAKKATSADVAASNFTFTVGDAFADTRGAIIRLTQADGVDITRFQASGNYNAQSSTSTLTDAGITPAYGGGLYCIFLGHSSGTGRTFSGYTFATSNPSWTEAYDTADSSSRPNVVMAYGARTQSTPTGVVTATASGNVDEGSIIVVYLPGIVAVEAIIQTMTLSIGTPTVPTVAIPAPLTITVSVASPTMSAPGLSWSSPDKSAAPSWVNPDKS